MLVTQFKSRYLTVMLVVMAALFESSAASREKISDKLYLPTDGATENAFVENPALIDPSRFYLSVIKLRSTNSYQVTADPNDDQLKFNYEIERDTTGLAYMDPIGGGATIGVYGEATKHTLTTRHPNFFRDTEEVLHDRHAAFRISLDLTPALRAGFAYHYYTMEAHVEGHWFASEEDFLDYTATMYGYSVGARYDTSGWLLHASHRPSMRGRSILDGQQLIFTEKGLSSIGAFTKPAGGISYGLELRRWFYQRAGDERASSITTTENSRSALLNGVDMEQFYYPIEAYSGSILYSYSSHLEMSIGVTQESAALFFRGGEDIGERVGEENRFTNHRLKFSGQYKIRNYMFTAGLLRHYRSRKFLDAPGSIFFDGSYGDYAGTEQSFFVAVNLSR